MSLDHILLGLLRRPAFGYELKAEFEASIRHFWPADLAQIYPTLQRLERQGLLRSRRERSPKGPPRKIYSVTPRGRAELARWLRSGPQLGTERFAYLAQLFFMDELADLTASRGFLVALRRRLNAWLEELRGIERQLTASPGDALSATSAQTFHQFAVLRMGIHTIGAKVAWCDECLERLDRFACRPHAGRPREK